MFTIFRNLLSTLLVILSQEWDGISFLYTTHADPIICFDQMPLPVLPDVEDDEDEAEAAGPKAMDKPKPLNAVEITTEDIEPKLDHTNVADLVLLSMVSELIDNITEIVLILALVLQLELPLALVLMLVLVLQSGLWLAAMLMPGVVLTLAVLLTLLLVLMLVLVLLLEIVITLALVLFFG